MTNSTQYHIGAIGAGGMGMNHIRAIVASPRWRLAYICDLQQDRLRLASQVAPDAKLTRDYIDMFQDPSVDAVSINTLSDVRPEIIRQAVAAGKHVLCEKPLAPTADEAQSLLDDIAGSDRLITTDLFNRNAPYLRQAKALIQEGEIGQLALMRLDHCTPGPSLARRRFDTHKAVEGHLLHDCGMHYVDVMRWFAGSEYRSYDARAVRFWNEEYELHFMVHGEFENDVVFELHNSFCYTSLSKERRNRSGQEFIGTHGVITMRHDFQTVTMQVNGRTKTVGREMPYGGKKLDVYYAEFARALDTGNLGQLPRVEDAVVASRISQAMVNAALGRHVPNFGENTDLEQAIRMATASE